MVRKAVIMAGGLATRLRPLTLATNKHMLPVYDRPMIQHVIETVVSSGITDIMVQLTNTFAQPVMELLRDGEPYNCSICYGYQSMGDSVAKMLRSCRTFMNGEPFLLMLGDSFYRAPLQDLDKPAPHMWVMPLQEFDDPRKYAEVRLDGGVITDIADNLFTPSTGIVQTGAWLFPPDVFERAERLLRVSRDREVKVRHLAREYAQVGGMGATLLPPESFLDLGTIEALYKAQTLMRERVLAQKTGT